jgi:outer membrane protein assembly factor BamA
LSNDGPILAFRVRHWQPAEYEDRVTANAALDAEAGISSRGTRYIFLRFKAPQLVDRWRFDVKAGAGREVRFGYFGLGNNTVYNKDLVNDATPFTYRVRRARYRGGVDIAHQLGDGRFLVAGLAGIEQAHFTALPGPSVFLSDVSSGDLTETDAIGRLALIYDTRDNEYNTHQGLFLEAGAQGGSGGEGYTRLYTLLRGYLTIHEGTVMAARLGASEINGTATLDARYYIPGWEKEVPVLGGPYSHRSLDTGRLAGTATLFGNLEIRHDLIAFGDLGAVTLVGFVDAGRVFEGEDFKLTTNDMKVGGGGALAFRILRSTIFTLNFAGGPDGFNFSFGTGWMF